MIIRTQITQFCIMAAQKIGSPVWSKTSNTANAGLADKMEVLHWCCACGLLIYKKPQTCKLLRIMFISDVM